MKLGILLICFLLQACSVASLQPEGEKIEFVDTVSMSDLLKFEKVGSYRSIGMISVQDCRNDLRNSAAKDGVQYLRIISTEPDFCSVEGIFDSNSPKKCFTMHADGYRKKAAPAASAEPAKDY